MITEKNREKNRNEKTTKRQQKDWVGSFALASYVQQVIDLHKERQFRCPGIQIWWQKWLNFVANAVYIYFKGLYFILKGETIGWHP